VTFLTSDNLQVSEPNPGPWAPATGSRCAGAPTAALQYLSSAVPEATRRAYESDLRHFYAWSGSIPATDLMVAEYLAAYAGELACSTLKRRLAAIAKAHRVYGLNSPTRSELVKATLRGIRRRHGGPLTRARESAAASFLLVRDAAALTAQQKRRGGKALCLNRLDDIFAPAESMSAQSPRTQGWHGRAESRRGA